MALFTGEVDVEDLVSDGTFGLVGPPGGEAWLEQYKTNWRHLDIRALRAKERGFLITGLLLDEKKYDEAITVLHQAVDAKTEEKIYFRQLGAVYNKANNGNVLALIDMMMFLHVIAESLREAVERENGNP